MNYIRNDNFCKHTFSQGNLKPIITNNPSRITVFQGNCLISGKTTQGMSPLVANYKHSTIMIVHAHETYVNEWLLPGYAS